MEAGTLARTAFETYTVWLDRQPVGLPFPAKRTGRRWARI